MKCSDVQRWFLQRRLPVVDLASSEWAQAAAETGVRPGVWQEKCLRRMCDAGMLRRVRRGLYVVVDPSREAPAAAIASAANVHRPHYVTTDAALSIHGLIDQPIPTITVITTDRGLRPLSLGATSIRFALASQARFAKADHYQTTVDGFRIELASRSQAVLDALDQPDRMVNASLLPEVLQTFDDDESSDLAMAALGNSKAAAQRLGFLLEEARAPIPAVLQSFQPTSSIRLRPGANSNAYSSRWRVYG